MAFSYAMTATSFAALSSAIWLLTGGGLWSGVWIYVLSGQLAMVSLIARAALWHRRGNTQS